MIVTDEMTLAALKETGCLNPDSCHFGWDEVTTPCEGCMREMREAIEAALVVAGMKITAERRRPGFYRHGKFITDDTDAANSLSSNGGCGFGGEFVGVVIDDGKITRFMTQDEMERNFPLL